MPGSRRRPGALPSTAKGRVSPARSLRLRRVPGQDRQHGEMVIEALVEARLLGLKILTLEARVVVGTDDGRPAMTSPVIVSAPEPAALDSQPSRPAAGTSGSVQAYARAMELLEQGTEALDRSRRFR